MFDDYIDKILEFGFPVKDLAFSVNNIFLEIKRNIFCNAEIFHRIRNNDPQFIAYPEEVINACLACKDYCSKIKNIDFLMHGNL